MTLYISCCFGKLAHKVRKFNSKFNSIQNKTLKLSLRKKKNAQLFDIGLNPTTLFQEEKGCERLTLTPTHHLTGEHTNSVMTLSRIYLRPMELQSVSAAD